MFESISDPGGDLVWGFNSLSAKIDDTQDDLSGSKPGNG